MAGDQVRMTVRVQPRFGAVLVLALAALTAGACATRRDIVSQGMLEADKYLFEKGQELAGKKKWLQAREHFQRLVENYPQSIYRPEAKLGLGDTYIGEDTTEALILAQNEFREFLTFYPTNPRADYAQYRIGYSHYKQMRAPDRDQTETRDAVAEWENFVERYPKSALLTEAKARLREARDRLSDSEAMVGLFYYRVRWYPGAIDRYKSLLKIDPDYSRRDTVYFHLAGSLQGIGRPAEAVVYYDRLNKEFVQSEFLDQAKQQMAAIEAAKTAPPPPPPAKK
jgi:outer membrane protein assembly factor BamD